MLTLQRSLPKNRCGFLSGNGNTAPWHTTLVLLSMVFSVGVLAADSTINTDERYGYAANAGWINFHPQEGDGTVTGGHFLSGYAYSANFGWINLGDGSPANGWRYENDSGEDFGVNVSGFGDLSGFAYGANIGWITFDWAEANDSERPRIDLQTGEFSGYAYGANIGWIDLGAGHLTTNSIQRVDSDEDGMEDAWEFRHFGSLDVADEESDYTGDGHLDIEHYLAGTDPTETGAPLRIIFFELEENAGDDTAEFEFTSSPERLYQVESTTDFETWEEATSPFAPDPGDVTQISLDLPDMPEKKFFRIRAMLPLEE
ncbi:MAG: hypothetical protein JJT75_02965 [Opitutales bacterium]|nr:hypothetical protein [Opitutales bacterium]